jgi:hypothetical protein
MLERAERLAQAMSQPPYSVEGEEPWTPLDVIELALDDGMARLEKRHLKEPVRVTLDLDRERDLVLKQYATGIEADASQVVRALLDQLRTDDALAEQVRARVREQS